MAGLAAMGSVEPRAIAYTAVQVRSTMLQRQRILYLQLQLRFALSSCGMWRLVDGLFDHAVFYHNIVGWFEGTEDPADKMFVDDLLLWWNRYGNHSHRRCPSLLSRQYDFWMCRHLELCPPGVRQYLCDSLFQEASHQWARGHRVIMCMITE